MKKLAALSIAALTLASSSFAEETSGSTTTTLSKIKEKMSAKYDAALYGPSVLAPLSATQPDTDNNLAEGGGALLLENLISVSYKPVSNIAITPVFYWKTTPVYGGNSVLGDSYLRVTQSNIVKSGGYSLSADVRLGFPTSDASQARNSLGYIRSTQVQNYAFSDSRFSLGLGTYVRGYAYNGSSGKRILELYAGPSVNYQIAPTLTAFLLFEIAGDYKAGADSLSMLGSDIEPGLSWDILPNLNFNPYVDIKTTEGLQSATLETTSLGANLTWKFL